MNNQQLAFEKLSKLKVGALFMAMGTGKTKVALDLINSKLNKINYVLWVCPYSLKNEIEAERLKWYPALKLDIVGCESIGSSDRIYLDKLYKVKEHNTFIVVDESLKIKNRQAKRTKRILELGSYAKYKLILNGTPLSKNVLDLYTQMQFLSPKILDMSFNQYKNQYCEYYVRGRLKNHVKAQYNIEHLISLIRPYIFDSELELGTGKHYTALNYELDNIEEYQEYKNSILINCGFEFDFFAITTLLQSFYCKSHNKAVLLDRTINEINDRVIVFVKFLESIPKEAKAITGDVPLSERNHILEEFKQGKFKVLYITYGCGSFGLNLQFCSNIIFAEHTFDYATRLQAEARIYRLGQEHDVNYYDLDCNVGLEKLIKASLNKKTNLLNEVKKEIERKGVEEWLKSI